MIVFIVSTNCVHHFHFPSQVCPLCCIPSPVGLVVKVSASRVADLGSIPAFAENLCSGLLISETEILVLQWLPRQMPNIAGSDLGLVGKGSVYCVWGRQTV